MVIGKLSCAEGIQTLISHQTQQLNWNEEVKAKLETIKFQETHTSEKEKGKEGFFENLSNFFKNT